MRRLLIALLFWASANPSDAGSLSLLGAGTIGPSAPSWVGCTTQVGGVSPSACRDWQANTTTGNYTEESNSCAIDASGATCTGSEYISASITIPRGPYLILIDATYPTTSPGDNYSLVADSGSYPLIFRSSGAEFCSGSGSIVQVSAASGVVPIALYWSGSAWTCSAAGSVPISAGSTGLAIGNLLADFGGYKGYTSYDLTAPLLHFAIYPGTFTNAQIQASSS
jgi:hypothetical protein